MRPSRMIPPTRTENHGSDLNSFVLRNIYFPIVEATDRHEEEPDNIAVEHPSTFTYENEMKWERENLTKIKELN